MATPTTPQRETSSALDERLRALEAANAALTARVERLEARFGPRDSADEAVVLAIAESLLDRPFTSAQLLHHSRANAALAEALEAADVVSGHDVGKLLHRVEGRELSGFVLTRTGESRAGIVWQIKLIVRD